MSWNYRVVKTDDGYGVFEVYYDEMGRSKGRTDKPMLNFFCESPACLLEEIEILKRAFDSDPLDEREIDTGN
jgi:hypothetical protein